MTTRHYQAEDGITGYAAGDVLIDDTTGERGRVVRDGRGLVDEQRYLIWKHLNEHGTEWQAEGDRIASAANAARSEKAKVQHAQSNPRAGETLVVRQSVEPPERSDKGNQSKAASARIHRSFT